MQVRQIIIQHHRFTRFVICYCSAILSRHRYEQDKENEYCVREHTISYVTATQTQVRHSIVMYIHSQSEGSVLYCVRELEKLSKSKVC